MERMIDETELARLEQLKEDSDNNRTVYGGDTIATVWYQSEAANAVPALVAEVRRLREALNKEHRAWQCADARGDGLEMDNAALREKVDAWEWWEECFKVMQWLVPMGPNRADACEEAVISTLDAQKRAGHADRE